MAKRLNDTAALQRMAPPVRDNSDQHESVSVSTRKIDNGYVVCKSESRDGEYKYSESFQETRPNLMEDRSTNANPDGSGAMSAAVKFMNR